MTDENTGVRCEDPWFLGQRFLCFLPSSVHIEAKDSSTQEPPETAFKTTEKGSLEGLGVCAMQSLRIDSFDCLDDTYMCLLAWNHATCELSAVISQLFVCGLQ